MPKDETLKDKIIIVSYAIIGAVLLFAIKQVGEMWLLVVKQVVAYLFYLLFLTAAGG